MKKTVVVFDYGSGNVHSAVKALEKVGARVELTSDFQASLDADGLVIPGVGAFDQVMKLLKKSSLDRIIDKRLASSRPVLGICVGMQVLFDQGIEHGITSEGLGQWPGTVEKLKAEKLPNIGWNRVHSGEGSELFKGLQDEYFYFVHSYAAKKLELDVMPPFIAPVLSHSAHGEEFLAAIENGPLSATQFHPEKSGEQGLQLLQNWLGTIK